ncbi:class I SAM-dependent methyltransferase [Cereibacter sphaeroides]|nr:class I SAM-dependent methyltransferase [Cereibacter sphaeroides]
MSEDPQTLAVYAARAGDYARLFAEGPPSAPLLAFIAALPPSARVLDLGCGPGGDSAHMAAAGHRPDPVDAAPQMVALARARGLPAREGSFDTPLTEVYDAAWASFSLLHATRAELPRHLAAIHAALKPGGLFHIGLKEGQGEERDALGRFYTYYTRPELTGLLEQAGFTVTEVTEQVDTGLAGTPALGLLVTARA